MKEKIDEDGQIKSFIIDFAPQIQKQNVNLENLQESDLVLLIKNTKKISTGEIVGGVIYPFKDDSGPKEITEEIITHCYLGLVNSYKKDKFNETYTIGLAPTLEIKDVNEISRNEFDEELQYKIASVRNIVENYNKPIKAYTVSYNFMGTSISDVSKIKLPADDFIIKMYKEATDVMESQFKIKKANTLILPAGKHIEM